MSVLHEDPDLFNLFGGAIAAIASIFSIALAIHEASESNRLVKRYEQISDLTKRVRVPKRLQAWRNHQVELEAQIYARQRVPSAHFVWLVIAALLWLFWFVPDATGKPANWMKVVSFLTAAIFAHGTVISIYNAVLDRKIVAAQYIAGQDVDKRLDNRHKYRVERRKETRIFVFLFTIQLLATLTAIVGGVGRGEGVFQISIGILATFGLIGFVLYSAFRDAGEAAFNVAAEYVKESHGIFGSEMPTEDQHGA